MSFDSTIRSNLSVGMPLDLLVYHRDSLILPEGYRVTEDDAYFSAIRRQWSAGLHDLLERLPSPPRRTTSDAASAGRAALRPAMAQVADQLAQLLVVDHRSGNAGIFACGHCRSACGSRM